jgi:hypothetical protein
MRRLDQAQLAGAAAFEFPATSARARLVATHLRCIARWFLTRRQKRPCPIGQFSSVVRLNKPVDGGGIGNVDPSLKGSRHELFPKPPVGALPARRDDLVPETSDVAGERAGVLLMAAVGQKLEKLG